MKGEAYQECWQEARRRRSRRRDMLFCFNSIKFNKLNWKKKKNRQILQSLRIPCLIDVIHIV